LESVQKIQEYGLEVMAGFIVGFDNDPPSVFQQQIEFIQQSGIISALVGLLNAPKKTKLYKRLKNEGRILTDFDGNNTNFSLNFIPKMDRNELLAGYRKVLEGIYSAKPFYNRVKVFFEHTSFTSRPGARRRLTPAHLAALLKSMVWIGIFDKSRLYYWRLFFWSLFRQRRLLPQVITYSIYGYHYRKVFEGIKIKSGD